MVVDVLDHGPGDGKAVVGAGAAAQLVEDDQAAAAGVMQDVGRLHHLDHEGALVGVDLVLRADAGENAVHQADASALRRHKGADLGHQGDQGDLAQKDRLAAHVGAGDDQNRLVGRQAHVVGLERLVAQAQLHHRMPAGDDFDHLVVGQLGANEAVVGRNLGQGRGHVQLGQGLGQLQQARRGRAYLGQHLPVDLGLELELPLLGIQDQALVFLQLGGDVALWR